MYKEVQAKSIITKSGLPGSDFVINPYTGCSHGCIYCYAQFMKKYTGHKEDWGKFVDIKINGPKLIKGNLKGKNITISSVTDAYQPIEQKYKLTRQILEKLIPLEPNICIITKSNLVTRDIDLFKQFKNIKVCISLSSFLKDIEPGASSQEDRIKAMKELYDNGIYTVLFMSPILPELSDWKDIINRTKDFVNEYWFENLNYYRNLKQYIVQNHNELLPLYEDIYVFKKSDYFTKLQEEIRQYCIDNDLKHRIFFH
jgi:DNA repair photolyase